MPNFSLPWFAPLVVVPPALPPAHHLLLTRVIVTPEMHQFVFMPVVQNSQNIKFLKQIHQEITLYELHTKFS